MPRGGHREKAGRPSTWKSGCKFSETKLIRVPAAIAEKVLEFAHKLESDDPLDLVTKSKGYSIDEIKEAGKQAFLDTSVTRHGRDKGVIRRGIEAQIKKLSGQEFSFEIETKSKAKQTHLEV
jgi:hypothetical protein